jgi:hypothetical protein
MAPTDSGAKIVRSWSSITAPTGEGSYYETEDGRTWRSTLQGSFVSGNTYATIKTVKGDNKMVPVGVR